MTRLAFEFLHISSLSAQAVGHPLMTTRRSDSPSQETHRAPANSSRIFRATSPLSMTGLQPPEFDTAAGGPSSPGFFFLFQPDPDLLKRFPGQFFFFAQPE
jgi:hypothetical protein